MTPIAFALGLLACDPAAAPEPAAPAVPEAARPDVLLITLDTTRADRLGAYGYDKAQTPNIDAVAARGRRYARASSPLPLTIPAHSAMLTGKLPAHLGIHDNGSAPLREEETTLAEILKGAGYQTGAATAAYVTSGLWGFSQGYDTFDDDWSAGRPQDDKGFWHAHRSATQVVDAALAWLETTDPEQPRHLWVHLYDAHFPYLPPPPFHETDRPYDGELTYVDQQVGRLLEAFDPENTLVIMAGDHGEGLGDHDELTHGLFVYEATQRVPLIMAGPGVDVGVVEEPVSLMDLLPTTLDLLEMDAPAGMDGRAVPGAAAAPIYLESWQMHQRFGISPHLAVIDGPLKLIDTPRPELYDLVADPGETKNLAEDRPADVARLKGLLAGAALPEPGAPVALDPAVQEQLAALGYVSAAPPPGADRARDPKDYRRLIVRLLRVERRSVEGDHAGAEQVLAGLVELYPDVPEVRARRARVLRRLGRNEEAVVEARALLDMQPDSPVAQGIVADDLLASGQYEEALEMFLASAESQGHVPGARARSLKALLSTPPLAERGFAVGLRWAEEAPDDLELVGVIGIEMVRRGDLAGGERMLKKAITAETPERGVALHLGRLALGAGKFPEAAVLAEQELSRFPDERDAKRLLVEASARAGRWEDVERVGAPLAAQAPDQVQVWHALAQGRLNRGKLPEARAALDAALALSPDTPDLIVLDANLMVKEGRPRAEAEARFAEGKAKAEAARKAAIEAAKKKKAADGAAAP